MLGNVWCSAVGAAACAVSLSVAAPLSAPSVLRAQARPAVSTIRGAGPTHGTRAKRLVI